MNELKRVSGAGGEDRWLLMWGSVRVSVSALCEPQEEPTWTLIEIRVRQKTNLLAGTGCFFWGQ